MPLQSESYRSAERSALSGHVAPTSGHTCPVPGNSNPANRLRALRKGLFLCLVRIRTLASSLQSESLSEGQIS
jgi:hypothetical protein